MSSDAKLQGVLALQAYSHPANAERILDVILRLPFSVKLDAEHLAGKVNRRPLAVGREIA